MACHSHDHALDHAVRAGGGKYPSELPLAAVKKCDWAASVFSIEFHSTLSGESLSHCPVYRGLYEISINVV